MSTFIETARNIVAGVQLIDNTIREADTERAELIMAIVAALEAAAALHSADVLQAHAQGVQDGLREAESQLAAARQRVEALGHQVADLHNALIQ